MLVIGLCGGSGSGKSTVARMLMSHNILHIDTDVVYKNMISSPSECTEALRNAFGDEIVNDNGSINRIRLGEIVFSDKEKHRQLNRISHSHVLREVRKIIKKSVGYLAVCVDAPMLFESEFDKECDILVAVIAPREERIKRITERDKISTEAAIKRINAQLSDEELITKVDFVINNDANTSMLEEGIDKLIKVINNKTK